MVVVVVVVIVVLSSPPQVLADGLSEHQRRGEDGVGAVPRGDRRPVHVQVRGVRAPPRAAGGAAARLLHDRRQDGQDARAAGALLRGGAQPRRRGQSPRRPAPWP